MAVPRPFPTLRMPASAARLLPTLVAAVLVVSLVDLRGVAAQLWSVAPLSLGLAIGLHAGIVMGLAWRWRIAVRALGVALAPRDALRLTFSATLFNMVLPTSVGGDVGRVWFGRAHGLDLARGTRAGLFDRMVGLAALLLLVAGSLPFILAGWPPVAGLIAVPAVALAALLTPPRRRLSQAVLRLPEPFGDRRTVAATLALSVLGHSSAAIVASLLAAGMGLHLPVGAALAVFPAVLLATMLPVSVGGWGLRELAAIPLLGLVGLTAEAAAAVALAFGLTQLAAVAAGAAVLQVFGRAARR